VAAGTVAPEFRFQVVLQFRFQFAGDFWVQVSCFRFGQAGSVFRFSETDSGAKKLQKLGSGVAASARQSGHCTIICLRLQRRA
jgi:hypothetical protein